MNLSLSYPRHYWNLDQQLLWQKNKSLTVYLLVVNDSEIGTKNFASLYVDVCKADSICLKGRKSSTHFSCTLQELHSPRPSSPGFNCFCVSLDMLLESTSLLCKFYWCLFSCTYFQQFALITSNFLHLFIIFVSCQL